MLSPLPVAMPARLLPSQPVGNVAQPYLFFNQLVAATPSLFAAVPADHRTMAGAEPEEEARLMEQFVNPALLPRVRQQRLRVQRREEDRGGRGEAAGGRDEVPVSRLWTRPIPGLSRGKDVVRHTIGQLRELVAGFRDIFSGDCT
jgi:hypothetical protein